MALSKPKQVSKQNPYSSCIFSIPFFRICSSHFPKEMSISLNLVIKNLDELVFNTYNLPRLKRMGKEYLLRF
jgi:hypothetical protein